MGALLAGDLRRRQQYNRRRESIAPCNSLTNAGTLFVSGPLLTYMYSGGLRRVLSRPDDAIFLGAFRCGQHNRVRWRNFSNLRSPLQVLVKMVEVRLYLSKRVAA